MTPLLSRLTASASRQKYERSQKSWRCRRRSQWLGGFFILAARNCRSVHDCVVCWAHDWGFSKMVIRALIALILLVAPTTAAEFKISPPNNLATMTMPCWADRQLSEAMTRGEFEPMTRGLLDSKTDSSQSMVVVWMHLLTGRAVITISQPKGEECLAAILADAE